MRPKQYKVPIKLKKEMFLVYVLVSSQALKLKCQGKTLKKNQLFNKANESHLLKGAQVIVSFHFNILLLKVFLFKLKNIYMF